MGETVWEKADLVTPMAIRVAATLRLADHLAEGNDVRAIAASTSCDPDALGRLLRHLVTAGLVVDEGNGRFVLTDLGAQLREGDPFGLRELLDIDSGIGRGDLAFVELLHSVRTGEAAYPVHRGRPFWDDVAADPERHARYDAQMGADVAVWARDLVGAYDWGSLGHLVDVGGGNGTLAIALLRAHPSLRVTVLDQPATAAAAARAIDAAGLADRASAVPGDFFESVPAGAGGYVLCAVLHDWDDDHASAILRTVRAAVPPGGRVLVVEKTGRDGREPRTDMNLRVLVYFGGRERTVDELADLASGAGLERAAVHLAGDLSIVELVPSEFAR